ncbi:tRNA(Thr) (cytosine(32)-N(3))-methyltransferase [Aspergillus vadensis CBS 113365]|uniref:tRNA N(3)-methylcytidine methyltransferase n=1 Tax=Aspergillus vadensis (strain CBS 113365 / IMI 142717 / IBT 24658) TaxID=1448311 RepID=A0A319C3M9_ASPVC|nr:actin binding protein [Aspergillus vadensis CBS 113365]PYH72843.1 actin binding protein [Aspergillus vadensis CBS 113365]
MAPAPIASSSDDIATVLQLVTPPQIAPHRSHDPSNNQKRSDPFQFGSRYLEEGDDVFEFNAWDHVEPDDEFKAFAEVQYSKQRETPVSDFDRNRFNADPAKWWNLFYKNNTANFFKNRKWLRQEFPVLADVTQPTAGKKVVLEVGAGAGNTAFPLLENNENEELMVHACDFSKTAVKVMRESPHYNPKYMTADVWDVTAEPDENGNGLPPGLTEESVDVVVLIFIFSALAPEQWNQALRNVYRVLKPGGHVLFRDYGRGDLAQVRFKKNRYMGENFYVRGDGTRVYFFDRDELEKMWGQWTPEKGLPTALATGEEAEAKDEQSLTDIKGVFDIEKLGVDYRLIVNRQRKLKMYRCWIQGHFLKRDTTAAVDASNNES